MIKISMHFDSKQELLKWPKQWDVLPIDLLDGSIK